MVVKAPSALLLFKPLNIKEIESIHILYRSVLMGFVLEERRAAIKT